MYKIFLQCVSNKIEIILGFLQLKNVEIIIVSIWFKVFLHSNFKELSIICNSANEEKRQWRVCFCFFFFFFFTQLSRKNNKEVQWFSDTLCNLWNRQLTGSVNSHFKLFFDIVVSLQLTLSSPLTKKPLISKLKPLDCSRLLTFQVFLKSSMITIVCLIYSAPTKLLQLSGFFYCDIQGHRK